MNNPDVIVIGTGVIGSAIAFELAKAGWKTLSIDRNGEIGHGSTSASCAIIRMHYSTWEGTALAWEGYHYWRDWAAYLEAPAGESLAQFRESGCLVMKTGQNGHLERHMTFSTMLDCPFEEWTPQVITERLPIYQLDSFAPPRRQDDPAFGQSSGNRIEGGVYWPNAGYVTDPALSAQNLAAAALRHGAAVRLNAEVKAILQRNGRVQGVQLSDGSTIHAPVVVNVAGPAAAAVNRMAGVVDDMTIALRPLRQEVAHVPAPEGFDFETLGMVVSDSDIGCYCRPEQGNHILIGSEDPECDEQVYLDEEGDLDRNFSEQWTVQAMRYAQRVPTLGIPNTARGVVDLYDASTDWIPVYDRSSLDGFYMACGTSGNQFKNAAIAAKMMAGLIAYCEAGHDHDAHPLTYRLPYIDRDLDIGFFSRRRPVNTESSFSVLG